MEFGYSKNMRYYNKIINYILENKLIIHYFIRAAEPTMTYDLAIKFPNLCYWTLAQNPNITLNIVKEGKFNFPEDSLATNPNIPISYIYENFQITDILLQMISRNPNIKESDIIKEYEDKYDWIELSFNKNFSLDTIIKKIDSNPTILSMHRDITIDIVKKMDIKWNWDYLSLNPNMTIKIIKENPNFPWNWKKISSRVEIKDIEENPDLHWCWDSISANHNIDINFVNKYLHKGLNHFLLSENPAITMEDIKNNNLYWIDRHILCNPNLTYKYFISINKDKHMYYYPMNNLFCYHPYFISDAHKKKLVKKFMETCFQELIEKTCTVARKLNWDEDFMEDCKNDFYEGGREFYLEECRKYT